jgi:hypothetical protein
MSEFNHQHFLPKSLKSVRHNPSLSLLATFIFIGYYVGGSIMTNFLLLGEGSDFYHKC